MLEYENLTKITYDYIRLNHQSIEQLLKDLLSKINRVKSTGVNFCF